MYVRVQKHIQSAVLACGAPYVLLNTEGRELSFYIALNNYEPLTPEPTSHDILLYFTDDEDWPFKEIEDVTQSIPGDQWIKLTPDARELEEVKRIIQRIEHRIEHEEPKIFKYTLVYLLLKLRWLYLFKRLRVRPNGLLSEKMITLLSHMKLNHTRHRSIEFYAGAIMVSEHYLGELCRNEINLTYRHISNLLLKIRILDLFYLSDMNFGEIAIELGFADQAHFTNFFKRELGVTPSVFRRGVLI